MRHVDERFTVKPIITYNREIDDLEPQQRRALAPAARSEQRLLGQIDHAVNTEAHLP